METKKYIIEIPDNTAWLQWVKVSDKDGHVYFDFKDPEDLIPYTEPDLEQVRKEAYEEGYKSGYYSDGYQRGLKDAWDAARKISIMDSPTRDEIFGLVVTSNIFDENSASEATEKIRQYKQDFKVGDEVISDEDIKGVTVDMDDYLLHVLDENGVIQAWPREDAVKTGRYFPEIAEVLKKMREEKE